MKLSIRRLVVLMCVGLVLLTALALSGVSAWQTASFASNSEQHLSDATDHRIDTAVSGLYNVVATQSESLSQRVATDMQVANDQLGKAGGFRTGGPTVRWQAKNQLTQEVESVELPQARVGSTWLGQVTSPGQAVPVVDPTKRLVGDTATIFQRMNDEGDMLRVATNVVGKDGKRVIGTYIAAKGADGKPNPVLEAVLAGKTYTGTAKVVDSWYVTQYAPLKDPAGKVVGMLYAGVKQESIATLRNAVLGAKVGENGSVMTLGTSGVNRGLVRFAEDEALQGQSVLDVRGQDGTAYFDAALTAAAGLEPGETATIPFVDEEGNKSSVRVAYFKPWDWTIAVITRDADFTGPLEQMQEARRALFVTLVVVSVLVALLGLGLAVILGRRITAPLEQLRDRMAEIADGDGDLTQRVAEYDHDEVGQLGGAFNRFASKVAATVAAVTEASEGVRHASGRIAEVTRELDDSASRSAEEANHAESSATVVGQNVAGAAAATEEMSASIREIADSAARAAEVGAEATRLAAETESAVVTLGESSNEIGNVIKTITSIAEQTNLLALNATIEAARAGEAGKGFAVVANEVKDLAQETASATEDISRRIEQIQGHTGSAVEAITRIAEVVRDINDTQARIAAAVEEQSATTAEVARGITHASDGVTSVRGAITEVNGSAQRSAAAVREARGSADELDAVAARLAEELSAFRI